MSEDNNTVWLFTTCVGTNGMLKLVEPGQHCMTEVTQHTYYQQDTYCVHT